MKDAVGNDKTNQEIELINHLKECKRSGIEYREKFRGIWQECEAQIRCVHPESWAKKEDWQTKIYIPQQAKKSEVVNSYLNKMLFGKGRNFDITADKEDDTDDAANVADLVDVLLDRGGFPFENKFVVNEASDIGTGFLKITMDGDGNLIFTWRSTYNILIDPLTGHNFSKSRFLVDMYKKDIAFIIEEAKKEKFRKEVVDKFLQDIATEGAELQNNTMKYNPSHTNETQADGLMSVKSIDGTQLLMVPSKYRMLNIDECWCKVLNRETNLYEDRKVLLLQDKYILQDVENTFDFIPYQPCRIKPRKYDFYGKGYIENTRGLQDLSNSLINLGMDSLKISSMDIVILDESKVKDPTSIKYKPLAIWKMKDVSGAKIQRNNVSAIGDILRGLEIIDQIDQDASGVTRQAQGAQGLSGGSNKAETLGEYESKLQAVDQRFLDVGRFLEDDYFIPLLKKIYRIVLNPKLFNQKKVNDILGMATMDDIQIQPDPNTGNPVAEVVGKKDIPKLDLEKLRKKGDFGINFRAVGVTKFTDKMEVLQKLQQAIMMALQSPVLTALTNVDVLWKRLFQASEIDDYEELLKTHDEVQGLLGGGQPMPPGPQMGGMGQPGPQPMMPNPVPQGAQPQF